MFDGTGAFRRIYSWVTDQANGILVRADRMDEDADNFAAGLSNCITRDGQSPATQNIPMGGHKITGLAAGASAGDAVNFGQAFNAPAYTGGVTYSGGMIGSGNVVLTGGTVDMDAMTAVLVPTAALGDSSTNAASTAFVAQAAFAAALPAQSLGFLRSTGTAAGFTKTHTGYAQNEVKGADIASAATIDLGAATGNFIHVTGAATISAITIPIGAERTVVFDGALTLTSSAALLLPGGGNILTAPNDRMIVRGDTAGAIVTSYARNSAVPTSSVPYLHVRDEKASGTPAGSSVAADITQTRTLNTIVSNTMGASLASNTITLPAGTYQCRIRAPAGFVQSHAAYLYNVTDGAYTKTGSTQFAPPTGQTYTDSTVSGQFTISAPKSFTVRHYTQNAYGAYGLGQQAATGQVEVYAEAEFWRIA